VAQKSPDPSAEASSFSGSVQKPAPELPLYGFHNRLRRERKRELLRVFLRHRHGVFLSEEALHFGAEFADALDRRASRARVGVGRELRDLVRRRLHVFHYTDHARMRNRYFRVSDLKLEKSFWYDFRKAYT